MMRSLVFIVHTHTHTRSLARSRSMFFYFDSVYFLIILLTAKCVLPFFRRHFQRGRPKEGMGKWCWAGSIKGSKTTSIYYKYNKRSSIRSKCAHQKKNDGDNNNSSSNANSGNRCNADGGKEAQELLQNATSTFFSLSISSHSPFFVIFTIQLCYVWRTELNGTKCQRDRAMYIIVARQSFFFVIRRIDLLHARDFYYVFSVYLFFRLLFEIVSLDFLSLQTDAFCVRLCSIFASINVDIIDSQDVIAIWYYVTRIFFSSRLKILVEKSERIAWAADLMWT